MFDDSFLTNIKRGSKFVVGEMAVERHPTFRYLKKGALVATFDGIDNALEYVTTEMPTPKNGKASSKHRSDEPSFYQFETYDKAVDVFRNNPESLVEFDETELRIKDANESGTVAEYDVVGDYIDMGRYMEGVPESFGTLYNGTARNRRITIMVGINQVWDTSAEDIQHRSERILRLVDALEAGGARTELKVVSSNETYHCEVVLKAHDESLVISDLAITTAPDYLRRIMFRIAEYSKTWDYGYGTSSALGNAVTADNIASDNVNEVTIFINGSLQGKSKIDKLFDQIERLLVWELSKAIPEVSAIKLDAYGVYFNDNGSRDASEIQREGKEVIQNEG